MSDEKDKITTPVKAISAIATIFSFLEKASIAFFMALLEYTRIKQKKAEDELANAKVDASIKEQQDAIEKETQFKSSADVIDDLLAKHDKSSSGGDGTKG